MKIADYGKAITSYIESPTKAQKDLSKARAEEANRVLLAEGSDDTPLIPEKKPKQLSDLFERINRTVLAIRSNTIKPEFILPDLEKLTQEYISDGLISGEDARKFAIERKNYWDKWITDNPKQTTPVFDFDNEGNATEVSEEEIIKRINEADGGRIGFGEGTKTKLVEFIEKFKLENNRPPTIMEVVDGAKSSTASIRKYLEEGVDFVKTDLSEVGKKGGLAGAEGKKTGVTKLDKKAYKELQDLRIKGVSFQTTKGVGGSVSVGIRIQDPKVAEAFFGPKKVTNYFPGDAKGIAQLKNLVEQIAVSDVYANNVLPFQTDEYKRKIKRFKEAQYKKKDPHGVYKALQKYKTEVFPADYSKRIQIQHGDAKFTAQTLSRMGLIDAAANISPEVEKAERLRNNALKTALATLDNPDASVAAKKAAAEKYNSIAKGLRGQLKGTPGQGFVNFQLLEVDDSGNYKKLKDISFDPKKGLVDSDLDLSKITKEEAKELIAKGKKKLDLEAINLKTGLNLKTADKAPTPEKSKTKDMFKKAFQIGKTLTKPVVRAVSPFLPVIGTAGTIMGAADVAEAAKRDLTNEELALAYFTGPDIAQKYSEYKDKPMKPTLAGKEDTPVIDDYTGETKSTFGKYNDQIKNIKLP
jgi:hypothetical protein